MKKVPRKNSRFGLGWMPDLPDNRDHLYSAPLAKLRVLPSRVDLRRRCPRIYNQGQIGSCTANAIGAAIQFNRKKQRLRDFIQSRLFIYYNERNIEHSIPLDNRRANSRRNKNCGQTRRLSGNRVALRRYSCRSHHESLVSKRQTKAETATVLLQRRKKIPRCKVSAS
jgi:hypothetical protein